MSHFIAQSITISKTKGVAYTGDDNNVYPHYNHTQVRPYSDEEITMLAKSLLWGCIQPVDSANDYRWWWILREVEKETDKSLDEKLPILKRLIESGQPSGEYILAINGGYIKRRGKTAYRTITKEDATVMRYYKAQYYAEKYSNGNNISIIKL